MLASRSAMLASIGASLLVVIFLGWFFLHNSATMPASIKQITQVKIGTTTVTVEIADTDATREQGLSGRNSLGEGSGMLFVFDTPGNYGFWMKDMRFSLDMLFADASGNIVTIDSDLSPSTYLQNPPQVFRPSAPVTYVLEVPAGFAKEHGVVEGMQFVLQ